MKDGIEGTLICGMNSVFVNGRPRPVIFEDMRRRIARGDIQEEKKEAIKAMCDIAADRARKLQ
jgi:2-oxo-4-hydroxy-4-carboxy--5-ureidoimidazoline (OHCU) decarboxylase